MTNYEWTISQIDLIPMVDDVENIVNTVHWRYKATHENIVKEVYGAETVTLKADGDFIKYEDLTEETVVGWIISILGKDRCAELAQVLDREIANELSPPVVSLALPWAGKSKEETVEDVPSAIKEETSEDVLAAAESKDETPKDIQD